MHRLLSFRVRYQLYLQTCLILLFPYASAYVIMLIAGKERSSRFPKLKTIPLSEMTATPSFHTPLLEKSCHRARETSVFIGPHRHLLLRPGAHDPPCKGVDRESFKYRFFGTPPSGVSGGKKSGDSPETPPGAAPLAGFQKTYTCEAGDLPCRGSRGVPLVSPFPKRFVENALARLKLWFG